jgi:hypothetical protein
MNYTKGNKKVVKEMLNFRDLIQNYGPAGLILAVTGVWYA